MFYISKSPHPTQTSTLPPSNTHMNNTIFKTSGWIQKSQVGNIITGRHLDWTPLAAQSQGVYIWAPTAKLAMDHRHQTPPPHPTPATEILENKNQTLTCLAGFRQCFNGAGWLFGVKHRTGRTFFLAPALIHSASERAWAVAHGSSSEHSDGRGQVEGSQGIVLWNATDSETFCDCLWARSINGDGRCTLFLSFTANWWFSSVS